MNPEEAPVVERIVALRASGATLRAIAATLNAEGVPARGGHGWNQMSISNIAKRRTK